MPKGDEGTAQGFVSKSSRVIGKTKQLDRKKKSKVATTKGAIKSSRVRGSRRTHLIRRK